MTKKSIWDDVYKTLVAWCEEQGWKVVEGPGLNCKAEEGGVITVGRLVFDELKVYSLMHEMGHLKIWGDPDFNTKYMGYERSERHRFYRVAVVEEEIKAWDAGLEIALDLDLPIDVVRYMHYKYDNVYAYIGWVRNPKRYDTIGHRRLKDEPPS